MEEIIKRMKAKLLLTYGLEDVSDKDAIAYYMFGEKAQFLQGRVSQ